MLKNLDKPSFSLENLVKNSWQYFSDGKGTLSGAMNVLCFSIIIIFFFIFILVLSENKTQLSFQIITFINSHHNEKQTNSL